MVTVVLKYGNNSLHMNQRCQLLIVPHHHHPHHHLLLLSLLRLLCTLASVVLRDSISTVFLLSPATLRMTWSTSIGSIAPARTYVT